MGKSLELLGLASFNVFLALILSTTFLSNGGASIVAGLNEKNVTAFITEASAIAGGKKPEMNSYDITTFFMAHIADDSSFKTTVKVENQNAAFQEDPREMDLDKLNYISSLLQDMTTMSQREAETKIEYVKVNADGRSASAMTTNYERGMMPIDDGTGEAVMTPVDGTSYCEQTFILSDKKVIQLSGATCTTEIRFTTADSF